MTPTAAPPGPRVAADLWSRLAPLRPVALAAGVVPLLHVESLVAGPDRRPLDPLTRATLAALSLADPPTAAGLDALLHVGEERAAAVLSAAGRAGWVTSADGLRLTDAGRDVLARGRPVDPLARRRFAFRGEQYVPIPDNGPLPATGATSSLMRGAEIVRLAFDRPEAWRRDAGLPTDVRPADPAALPDGERWRGVAVEAEVPTALVVVRPDGPAAVRGFVAGADWAVPAEPAFALAGDPARAAFPELFADPSDADLRAAWLGWAKFRGVAPDDLAACRVALDRDRLVVRAPDRLAGWLRAHRAEVLAGDTWVWVGTGHLRRPAALDVRA